MARRQPKTAAELMAELNADPEWVKATAEKESQRLAREAAFRMEEGPMIADLAQAGWRVGSVYDLVNTAQSYPSAVPVLLKHLARPYHPRIRQGIARALTVKEARGLAGPVVMAELRKEADDETRWTLANTLTVVAAPGDGAEIRALLAEPAYGEPVHERLREALKNLGEAAGSTAR